MLALLGLGLSACQPDLEKDFEPSNGTADFSNYIAVGNSLTAGFSDGGLYLEGQQQSFPAILAQQFATVGGGEFVQPLFTSGQENGSGYLRLAKIENGLPVTASVTTNLAVRGGVVTRANPSPLNPQLLYTKYTGTINNLGVPGIRLSDIETVDFGNKTLTGGTQALPTPIFNSYFERITPDGSSQTYLQRVAASNPTFFTNWLGNNDVLGFATAGGAANSLTSVADFTDKNSKVIEALTATGAKGVVVTIPDVTTIPFFTTVGPSFRATLEAGKVPGLVIQTGAAPGGPTSTNRKPITTGDIKAVDGTGRQLFTLLSSPFLPLVGTKTGRPWRYVYAQSGQPAAGFPLFLAAYGIDTLAAFGVTAGNPIPSLFVLDDVEQGQVRTATNNFNAAIKTKAAAKGLAVFDANAFFSTVASNGLVVNGVNNTAGFVSGNLFSLDGVHPTPRGYAVVANEMIKVINSTYGAKVPTVNPTEYRGVKFP